LVLIAVAFGLTRRRVIPDVGRRAPVAHSRPEKRPGWSGTG
jgi:hypothetical protein